MLIAQLSYSQDSLPRKLVIDGDTGVFITVSQAKKTVKAFLSAEHYSQISDSLQCKIELQEERLTNDSLIISKKDTIIEEFKSIVELQDQAQAKLEEEYAGVNKKLINSRKWGRVKNQALGVSVAAILLVLLVK